MFHVEHPGRIVANEVAKYASSFGINLTQEQLAQFSTYSEELLAWNEKIGLTAVVEYRDMAIKHFLDSILGLRAIRIHNEGTVVFDIGSGGGFPGIPLKIASPSIDLYMIEKNKRKASFLTHLVGKLRLKRATVLATTFQDLGEDRAWRSAVDFVVVRAVNIGELLDGLSVILKPSGRAVLYRTQSASKMELPVNMVVDEEFEYALPLGFGRRRLVVLASS